MKTIQLLADPGHGWGLVDTRELLELGIEGEISRYSYISRTGEVAALEEDCDLSIYLEALNKRGIDCQFSETHVDNTEVRFWPSYRDDRISRV